jgi:hypothetical protein
MFWLKNYFRLHKGAIKNGGREKRRSTSDSPDPPANWEPCVRNCSTQNPSQRDKCRAICG